MKFSFKRKRDAWDDYNAIDVAKRAENRDVFSDQQVKRSTIGEETTMTSRIIFVSVMTALIAILVWVILSAGQFAGSSFSATLPDASVSSGSVGSGTQTDYEIDPETGQIVSNNQSETHLGPDAGTGSYVMSLEEFNAIRGIDFDTFADLYFERLSMGMILHFRSRVTGEEYDSSDVISMWQAIVNGNYAAYLAMYGGSSMGDGWADENNDANYLLPDGTDSRNGSVTDPGAPGGVDIVSGSVNGKTLVDFIFMFRMWKFMVTLLVSAIAFAIMYAIMYRNWQTQHDDNDVVGINQWPNDQHIQFPQELMQNYDWFPDVGAHAPVQVSSMLSHVMLTNKGVKKILLTRHAEKDIKAPDGSISYFKGEVLYGDDGLPMQDEVPMFDKKFGLGLYDSAKILDEYRIFFDPKDIKYNPDDENRDKLKGAKTVADMINKYWEFPDYEPQRPAGAYIVDTAPVNTMLLAITRAGKG